MSDTITVFVNGTHVLIQSGMTVAAAVMRAGFTTFRLSVRGEGRGPLCGMGICFECRVMIDGQPQRRSCQVLCYDGMDVRTSSDDYSNDR